MIRLESRLFELRRLFQSAQGPRPHTPFRVRHPSAIETYPAVALKSAQCASLHELLFQNLLAQQMITKPALQDVRDALACAVVAYLAAEQPDSVIKPPADYPTLEGWIIMPK